MSALANSLYEVCVFASATFWLSGCLAEEPTADYRTLPGEFAREVLTEPLVATEAFIDDEQFYVRYEGPGGTLYSGGEWTQRIPVDAITAGESYAGPYILPLAYQRDTPWPDPPATRKTGRILSEAEWQAFRDRLLATVLPKDGNNGIVLQFAADDYFLYYDEADEFRSLPLIEKPAEYSIQNRISFREFLQQGVPLLELFLAERNIN
ncbi:unnamed protein product, partial [marine sediment metagenome]